MKRPRESVNCAPIMWLGGKFLDKLYWDKRATYYDSTVRPVDGFIYICEKRIISDIIKDISNLSPMLELGIGTARHTLSLADKGFRIVGIDIGKRLVKIARRKLRAKQNVDLIIADGEHMPLKSKVFTTIVSIQTLDYVPNFIRALQESKNALKANGQIIITLLNGISPYYALTKKIGRWRRDYLPLFYISDLRLMPPSEIETLFVKNGFKVVNMHYYQILPIRESFSIKLPKFVRLILALLDYMFGKMPLIKYLATNIVIHASVKNDIVIQKTKTIQGHITRKEDYTYMGGEIK